MVLVFIQICHQNWSIYEFARMILVQNWSYMTLDDLLCLHNVHILEKFLKHWALNKKIIPEKDDF